MTIEEEYEVSALIGALWWARSHLTYNVSTEKWKKYCSSLDYNLDFYLR